jgi:hypothetical protein
VPADVTKYTFDPDATGSVAGNTGSVAGGNISETPRNDGSHQMKVERNLILQNLAKRQRLGGRSVIKAPAPVARTIYQMPPKVADRLMAVAIRMESNTKALRQSYGTTADGAVNDDVLSWCDDNDGGAQLIRYLASIATSISARKEDDEEVEDILQVLSDECQRWIQEGEGDEGGIGNEGGNEDQGGI